MHGETVKLTVEFVEFQLMFTWLLLLRRYILSYTCQYTLQH